MNFRRRYRRPRPEDVGDVHAQLRGIFGPAKRGSFAAPAVEGTLETPAEPHLELDEQRGQQVDLGDSVR